MTMIIECQPKKPIKGGIAEARTQKQSGECFNDGKLVYKQEAGEFDNWLRSNKPSYDDLIALNKNGYYAYTFKGLEKADYLMATYLTEDQKQYVRDQLEEQRHQRVIQSNKENNESISTLKEEIKIGTFVAAIIGIILSLISIFHHG